MKGRKRSSGQGLMEVAAGGMILIIIGLFFMDLTTLVLANTINVDLAKNAARAAASHESQSDQVTAAKEVIGDLKVAGFIREADFCGDGVKYDQQNKNVTVSTKLKIALPVQIPGFPTLISCRAMDTEPVVGAPADF